MARGVTGSQAGLGSGASRGHLGGWRSQNVSQLPQLGHTTPSSLRKGQGPRSGHCPVPPSPTASHCRSLSTDFSNALLAGQPCSPKCKAGRARRLSPDCRGGVGEGLDPVTRSLLYSPWPMAGTHCDPVHDLFPFWSSFWLGPAGPLVSGLPGLGAEEVL